MFLVLLIGIARDARRRRSTHTIIAIVVRITSLCLMRSSCMIARSIVISNNNTSITCMMSITNIPIVVLLADLVVASKLCIAYHLLILLIITA